MRAWSGGRRGTKGDAAEHDPATYDVFRQENHGKGIHRGPLPPGIYVCRYVAHHAKFGECVFLEQTITALLQIDADAKVRFYDRDGFYVHARGPHGSDGCIKAVKNASGTVILRVAEQRMPLPEDAERATRYA